MFMFVVLDKTSVIAILDGSGYEAGQGYKSHYKMSAVYSGMGDEYETDQRLHINNYRGRHEYEVE